MPPDSRRDYIILEHRDNGWTHVATLPASSAQAAIRAHIDRETATGGGAHTTRETWQLAAVPARSWLRATVHRRPEWRTIIDSDEEPER